MSRAGETDHDKELQKAFAEFKQSLRHDPQGSHDDTAPKIAAPEIVVAEPRRPSAPQPKVDTRPVLGASLPEAENDPAFAAEPRRTPEEGRRRGLLYLSAAIVVSGLAAVGWTLNHGARPEASPGAPATAAITPENASPDATATTETQAPPASAKAPPASAKAPPASAEAPPASAEAQPAPADAPTAAAAQTNSGARATQAPLPTPANLNAAPANPSPAAEKAVQAPPAMAEPASPPAFPAAIAPTPVKTESDATKVKQTSTAVQPEARAVAKPAPAVKPRLVKAKPKPAPARNASRPASPATSAEPPAPPAPVAETAPPAPPPSSDGALGFVKRTVNSVGSTITNLGRSATGN